MLKLLKKIIKFLTSRFFILAMLFLIQFAALSFLIYQIGISGFYVELVFRIIAVLVCISILNRPFFNPAYKLSWILMVTLIPFIGTVFYLLFSGVVLSKRTKRKMNKNYLELCNQVINEDIDLESDKFLEEGERLQKIYRCIRNTTSMPLRTNTITSYLSSGEEKFKTLIYELKQAQKFIFLEYFIIKPGKMWDTIYEILLQKVNEGVEVRIIYDDFGCLNKLPFNFKKKILQENIKIVAFNAIKPSLNAIVNYRDHRKIVVIDGNVAFTGGINIGDEYINETSQFGHWKDAAIMLKGDAVYNLTLLFIEAWRNSTQEPLNYNSYMPTISYPTNGYVLPFGDGPFFGLQTTEKTYMQIIQSAKKYVYITTPYLILDNETITVLITAALSGIDVRIITPSIPDKRLIFWVTQSYYKELIEAGVKIYEYTPGFIHSKILISDDEIGMIGTANLDFRSLYLHFEVTCLIYKTNSLPALKEDFSKILDLSNQITYEQCVKINIFKRVIAAILRAFSPML